jgi:hypothetical protein
MATEGEASEMIEHRRRCPSTKGADRTCLSDHVQNGSMELVGEGQRYT